MKSQRKRRSIANTRASPGSDVKGENDAANVRAYPRGDDMKKYGTHVPKVRIASWNVGSMTGRGSELSEVMLKRRISICCIQETKWKGSKARNIGNGYKFIYTGKYSNRNGVGIAVDKNFQSRIVDVKRVSDRIISIKFALDNQPCMNVISAYAPQVGLSQTEKQAFWDDLYEVMQSIPSTESKYIGADFNGHVGRTATSYSEIHGNYGYGSINAEGNDILSFAFTFNMAIINTFFSKRDEHLITYKSGGKCTQVDYILADRKLLKTCKNCKVIPGEPLTFQHRLIVADFKIPRSAKVKKALTPKIRWYKLNQEDGIRLCAELKDYMENDSAAKDANTMWNDFHSVAIQKATSCLGVSNGNVRENKDPTFWNPNVQEKISTKKQLFKIWQNSKSEEDRKAYQDAKKNAKRIVAQTRALNRVNFYSVLENASNDKQLFKVVKQKHRDSQDTQAVKYIKNSQGTLLTSDKDINERWKEYYSGLLNETYPYEPIVALPTVEGPWPVITPDEVKAAVRNMANNRSTGPDDLPAEIWKKLGSTGAHFLTDLLNKVPSDGIPLSWRKSFLVPFYKNKGDIRHCGNYRAIKLISHTFKIWERVINERLHQLTTVTENQCGFIAGKSTTDAIHTIRILMESHRDRNKDLHMVFIDLEKAFDRIPRPLIWQALRSQNVPECYIRVIVDMYSGVTTRVRCPAGVGDEFHVEVGVHQGSALSPLLFNLVMNYLTSKVQQPTPWNILYADDVVLIDSDPVALQATLEIWRVALETAGLRISREKTEHMHCKFANSSRHHTIYLQSSALNTVPSFKYLGSVLSNDGNIDTDIEHRRNVGWQKWRELTGVLCDAKMPIHIKGKVYKTAVRPALTYGSECWPLKQKQADKLHVTEMRMLRWSAGVTLLDKVPNHYIRGSFKVRPIEEKLAETRLRWYGHVMRRPVDHMTRKVLELETAPKKRGRPRLTWIKTVERDIKKDNMDPRMTQNRQVWAKMIRRADPN